LAVKGEGAGNVQGGRDSFRMSAPSNEADKDLREPSLNREERAHSSRSTEGEQEVTGAGTPHKTLFIESAGAETANICDAIIDMEEVIGERTLKLDGGAKGAFYALSLQSDCFVEIEVMLAPEAWRFGMEEIVADGVRCDVTRALDGCREKVLVQRVDRGSGVVRMVLCEGVCGKNKLPMWAAYELQRQFQDSSSRLRQGAMSSMALAVRVVAEVMSDDIIFEDMEPKDGVAVAPEYDNCMRELSCTPRPTVFQVSGHLGFQEAGEGYIPADRPPLVRTAAASSSGSGDPFESDDSLPPLVPAAMLAPSPAHNMITANAWRHLTVRTELDSMYKDNRYT